MLTAEEHRAEAEAQRKELVQRDQERQRIEEGYRRDIARLEEDVAQSALEHQRQVSDLEASLRPKPVINMPFVILAATQLRGPADPLRVPPEADFFTLIIQLDAPELYSRYRLEILETGTGREVWRNSNLETIGVAELSVAMPRGLMPTGEYELHLHGLREGRAEKLAEHVLSIESE